MYHSIAMMDLKKHPVLTNFCRVCLFDAARDATKAHPFICKLLDTLPEVIASPSWLVVFIIIVEPSGIMQAFGP